MNPPLSREELRRVMLKRVRKQQNKAIASAGVVLSDADNYLTDGLPSTLAYLERRYLALREALKAENNALQVLVIEFVTDVAEAREKDTTLAWVYSNRATNRVANRRAYDDVSPRRHK